MDKEQIRTIRPDMLFMGYKSKCLTEILFLNTPSGTRFLENKVSLVENNCTGERYINSLRELSVFSINFILLPCIIAVMIFYFNRIIK